MAAVPRPPPARAVAWRPMRSTDVTYVAALEAQIHAAPWTTGNFRDALASGYSAQVGEREGRIVAFGVMMMAPGEAQLLNLSVVPDARRQGLGRELLRRFLGIAARAGAAQLFLEVRVGNAAAISLYEDEAFVRVARRARYYPADAQGVREDALVMRHDIDRRR